MTTENHLEAVVRKVRELLAAQVHPNVVLATYGGDVVELTSLPAVILYLPRLQRRRTELDNEPDQVMNQTTGTFTDWEPARRYDAIFRYEIVADALTLTRLTEGLVLFYETNGTMAVDRPSRAGGMESIQYWLLETQEPAPSTGNGEANRLAGQFTVRGVEIRQTNSTGGTAATSLNLTFDKKGA